jgi:hypothetical protein
MKRYWIAKWSKKLGIKQKIRAEYVPRAQVSCSYNRTYHLVGICGDTILHDRRLTEADIVHELCHKRWPYRKESWIRRKTNELTR